MQKATKTALLVGSPRREESTSNSLGTFLAESLQAKGVAFEKVYLNRCLCSNQDQAAMLRLVDNSDLIILAFPLYADCLHSQVIETLELIAEHRKNMLVPAGKSFVAIANCGFPEAQHNATALAVCRLFAKEAGFSWAGGLCMGGGEGMISGQPLAEVKDRVRNQIDALEMAADALAKGEPVPQEAVDLMSKLPIPKMVYLDMANKNWNQSADKDAKDRLYDQPFRNQSATG